MLWRSLVVTSALVTSARAAWSEPAVEVRAGACPSRDAIASALAGRVRVVEAGAAVTIAVSEGVDGVVVRIESTAGPSEVRLEGRDCAVLASAIAAIADAWFVELAPRPPIVVGQREPLRDAAAIEPAPTVPARARLPRWNIAVARALVIDAAGETRAANQLELGWTAWRALRLQARFDWTDRAQLPNLAGTDALTRRTWGATLAFGPRFARGPVWFETGAGAALVVSRVEGTGEMMIDTLRSHAAVAATASAGYRLGMGASLRVDAGGLIYPARDRYTLQSETVTRAPRAEATIGIGLEIAFGRRFW